MSDQVEPRFKDNVGPCEGRCDRCSRPDCEPDAPRYGTLGPPARDGNRRVRGCGDPTARGKRSNKQGHAKQSKALKRLAIIPVRDEENAGGLLRCEAKSGAQVRPVITRFLAMEAQSEASRSFGDHRPFVAQVALPGDDEILLFRSSKAAETVAALWFQLGLDKGETA